ncbi:MAG TPA: cysteine desulfurase [Planctomycetota bacterium]|jgi:cysteine desulfurase/selenocysteine lyase
MGTATALDVRKVRADFPLLARKVRGKPLVYLDNAATTQKPRAVLDAIRSYYETENSNIHRGVHYLSELATKSYEWARLKVRAFLNAADGREIVFVRGATEAINLVANSFARASMKPGDEVLITTMEHHSNIVPWQILRDEHGIVLKVAPIADDGSLILDEFEKRITPKTKLVSVAHVSNALGTVNPVKRIVEMAHARGVPVLVDGAQAAPHLRIDVQDLGCDFYAFSGHKIYAPTGIGVLYAKAERLEAMPPYQGGGEMILSVTFEKTVYNRIPHKFEAGTPNIEGAIGLGAALDYLAGLGLEAMEAHEEALLEHGTKALSAIKGLRIIGTAPEKAGVISFVMEGIHPHDIGTILDQQGIAIRTGHHCAQPVMERFGVPATARASLGVYNMTEDLDALAAGLRRVGEVFGT